MRCAPRLYCAFAGIVASLILACRPAHAYYFTYGEGAEGPTEEVDVLQAPGATDSYHRVTQYLTLPGGFNEQIVSRAAISIVGPGGTNYTGRQLVLDQPFTIRNDPGDFSLLVPVTVRYSLLGHVALANTSATGAYGTEYGAEVDLYSGANLVGRFISALATFSQYDQIIAEMNQTAFTRTLSINVPYTLETVFYTRSL